MKIYNPFTFEELSCEEKKTLLQRLCDLEKRAKYLSTKIPDLSGLTATPSDVAVGVKFIGAAKAGETGTAIIANLTTKNATMNGTYTPASPYNGFSEFTVDVAQTGTDVSDTTLTAPNALAGYYFYLADGTKTVGTMVDYTGLSMAGTMGYVTGSNYAISINSSGYYASSSSSVYISQSEIAADVGLTAAKLATGNTVLGVTGTAVIANLTTKTITSNGTYTPASPYNGFSSVTVGVAQTGTDVSDTTLTAPNARAGYYFYLADGTKTSGTMVDYTGLSVAGTMGYVTGSNYAVSIGSSGYYASASSAVYISQSEIAADVGLTAAKLAAGNTVLGVTGTAVIANLTTKTITSNGTYTPASPYNGFSSVTVSVSGGGGTDFPNPPTAGDCPVAMAASGGVVSTSSATVLTSLTISVAGTYRFKFWAQTNSGTTTAYLNKNGIVVTYWSTVYNGGSLYTYDLACAANDVITVTGSRPGIGNEMFCSPLVACIAWNNFPY